jgi:CobQ-like glutamine amidotransferase family enzyme
VLARNTALADLLLSWALAGRGEPEPLDPLDDSEELALRNERLAAVDRSGRGHLAHRLFRHRG